MLPWLLSFLKIKFLFAQYIQSLKLSSGGCIQQYYYGSLYVQRVVMKLYYLRL